VDYLMAIATYGDLKTAVANWLERSDLTAVIPDFISLARAKAFRGDVGEPLRVNAMVASTSITITAGVGSLPARWLEFLSLRWTGQDGPQLRFVPAQSFWSYAAAYEDVSTPQYYTVEGQNIRLQTTGTTTVNAVYYAAFADLVADSDTDWVLTNAPQLWLHGALAEAASYIGDDARQAREAGLFANAIGALNRSDRRARNSGAVLQSIPATVI
jgi:hypothetical protein